MKQYLHLLERVIKEGRDSGDRTGVGTRKIFGHQSSYNMSEGFPLLTIKNTWMKGVTHELLWLLGNHKNLALYKDSSITNINYLVDNKVHIWDEWADQNGDLGPVYGKQWVDWERKNEFGETDNVNQIQNVINKLTEGHEDFNPMDRGLVVSAWNAADLDKMALRPCHAFFQFQASELSLLERIVIYNSEKGDGWKKLGDIPEHSKCLEGELDEANIPKYELSLQLYQRSSDIFLGVPFNIASYALLLHMFCHVTGMKPGKFVHTFGDAHIYSNHRSQVSELLSRTLQDPKEQLTEDIFNHKNWSLGSYEGPELPTLWLNPEIKNIFDFQYEDIKVLNYKPLPTIKADVAI